MTRGSPFPSGDVSSGDREIALGNKWEIVYLPVKWPKRSPGVRERFDVKRRHVSPARVDLGDPWITPKTLKNTPQMIEIWAFSMCPTQLEEDHKLPPKHPYFNHFGRFLV